MKISIDAFECTKAGLNALSQTNDTLSVEEKKIIDLIFSASYANPEQLKQLEATFEQLSETVNLTRLVALKLLKFHNGQETTYNTKNTSLIEALFERRDMIGRQHTAAKHKQNELVEQTTDTDQQITEVQTNLKTEKPLTSHPELEVAMGLFNAY